jgi:hypothetical protein
MFKGLSPRSFHGMRRLLRASLQTSSGMRFFLSTPPNLRKTLLPCRPYSMRSSKTTGWGLSSSQERYVESFSTATSLSNLLQYLRSGFSAQGNFPDDVIPSDMATDVEGTMHVYTMGWTFHSRAFEYIIAPASIVAVIIFLSVYVWARHRWWAPRKHSDPSAIQLKFNPDDEVHRVVAVMAGDDLAEVFGGPIGAEVSVEAPEMVQFVHEKVLHFVVRLSPHDDLQRHPDEKHGDFTKV